MASSILLLLLGSFLGACSIVFIKFSTLNPILFAAYRLLTAGILLLPVYIRKLKQRGTQFSLKAVKPSIIPGILLGLHFIFWNTGAGMTTAANATLIVNMVPIAMPFFAFFLYREVLNLPELAGTILAVTGVVILGRSDFHLSRESLFGDISCFIAMIFAAGYLAMSRKNNKGESIWLYIVPLYLVGGFFSFVVSLFFTKPWAEVTWFNGLMVLGLAGVSTIGGHTILNFSMRQLRSQLVTLINLMQIVYGALLGMLFFREIPTLPFFIASPVILAGTVLSILFSKPKTQPLKK